MDILEYTEALRESRMRAANDLQALTEEAHRAHPGEPFTGEEQQKLDRITAHITELEASIRSIDAAHTRERESAVATEALERSLAAAPATRQAVDEAEELRAFFRGERGRTMSVDFTGIEREKQLIRQGASPSEVRALLWDTGSSGSLIPTTLSRTLYEYMEAGMAMWKAPTTKINTASGESMVFPRVGAHAIATQVIAQGTAIGGTDPTFAKMTLDAYKYGELVQVANEVIQDSGIDIVSFVGRDVGRAVGRVIDADLVVGTGSGEPMGLMTAIASAGTIVTGGSLIPPTVENLIDLVYSVNDEYRSSGSTGWLMKDATAGVIRKLRDGAGGTVGAFIWEPSLTAGIQGGQPDRLLGFPLYTDPNVAANGSAAKSIFFGDFSAYYIRTVGSFVLERSDEYAFNVDEATFRDKWRADGDLIDTTAGNIITQRVS